MVLSIKYWKSVVPPARCNQACKWVKNPERWIVGKPAFKYTYKKEEELEFDMLEPTRLIACATQ